MGAFCCDAKGPYAKLNLILRSLMNDGLLLKTIPTHHRANDAACCFASGYFFTPLVRRSKPMIRNSIRLGGIPIPYASFFQNCPIFLTICLTGQAEKMSHRREFPDKMDAGTFGQY